MAETITAKIVAHVNISTIADAADSPAGEAVQNRSNAYSKSVTLDSASTPAADTHPVDLSDTLTGTTKDFDLTAAPKATDITSTVDLTGKKLIAYVLTAASANNVAGVTFAGNGGNAYDGFGTIVIKPGETYVWAATEGFAAQRDAVAAGDKDVRITGTIGDVVNILAQFGA